MGTPGVIAAPAAYDVWNHEGRGLAVVHVDRAGTFVLHVQPVPAADVDPAQQVAVTSGTLAIGRDASRTWLGRLARARRRSPVARCWSDWC